MILNRHINVVDKVVLFTFFEGRFFFKSCRKPLFTVLWNLRVKGTDFLGHFKWCPFPKPLQRFLCFSGVNVRVEDMVPSSYTTTPPSSSYFNWSKNKETSNPWKMLRDAGSSAGRGTPYVEYRTVPSALRAERTYFTSKITLKRRVDAIRHNPHDYLVAVGAQRMNFTSTSSRMPSLYIQFSRRDYWSLFHKPRVLILFHETEHFVYCRTQSLRKKTDILFALFSPFDRATWGTLAGLFMLIGFIPKLCRVLDLLAVLLLQAPQRMERFLTFTVGLSLLLIPLQSDYSSYFTSNAVKPFEEKYIETNQELFDSGFRTICTGGNISLCITTERRLFNASYRKLRLDWTLPEQYFIYINYPELKRYAVPGLIGWARDIGAYVLEKRRKRVLEIATQIRPRTECHLLEEEWRARTGTMLFNGPYNEEAYTTLNKLRQAGFAEFWKSAIQSVLDGKLKNILTDLSLSNGFSEPSDSEIKYMNGSIISQLILFSSLQAFNLLCFTAELLFKKLEVRWMSSKFSCVYFKVRGCWSVMRVE